MAFLSNTTKTRFKLTVIFSILLILLAVLAVLEDMEGLASACVANIMIILPSYIFNETRRPSGENEPTRDLLKD